MTNRRLLKPEAALLVLLVASLTPFASALGQVSPAEAWPLVSAMPHLPVQHLPSTVKDGFSIAIGGDLLGLWQPVTKLEDPALAEVSQLFRDATVG